MYRFRQNRRFYDLLLTNIRFVEKFEYSVESVIDRKNLQNTPRLKSGNETGPVAVEYFFYNGVILSGLTGECVCYVLCGAYGYLVPARN